MKFRLSASAGTVLDIAHGEHLADGRVRCKIGDRNFADRYICAEGTQEWEMPIRRIGCRYLEIHASEQKTDIEFEYVGIKSAVYPVDLSGQFHTSDLSHNQIFSTAVETSRLCMHEHFEDCPWREQSLYAMDAKTQSLISYYLFGDYQYAKESLSLLGRTIRSDGYLELCSPSEIDFTIPCFSMAWIVSVYNYYLYSGDKDFVNQLLPQMKYMLTTYMQNLGEEGVMLLPTGKNYWNFYEWSPAMNGYNLDSMSHTPNRDSEKIHSCLNLFLLEALDACGRICRFVNDAAATDFEACAGKIRQGLRKYFCLNKGYFIPQENDRSSDSIHSQLIQALGLKLKVFLPQFEDSSRWALAYDKSLSEISLGMHNYYYEALLQKPDLFGGFVLDHIGNRWGKMIKSGSSAFWETILGHEDFDGAGSLCHGWSAIPAYIYLGYVLGIKPIKPGFKTFLVSPVPGNLLSAVGSVPTPEGLIKIEWKKKHDKYILNISCPPRLEPKISICKDYAQFWEINRL